MDRTEDPYYTAYLDWKIANQDYALALSRSNQGDNGGDALLPALLERVARTHRALLAAGRVHLGDLGGIA